MPAIELNSTSAVCRRCGHAYGRMKGNFSVSYSPMYKGVGYLPYCQDCVDKIYAGYLNDPECGGPEDAVRQACRKLDIYWSPKLFASTDAKSASRSIMVNYIASTNRSQYAGKCYDDTLREESDMWAFNNRSSDADKPRATSVMIDDSDDAETPDQEVVAFWGAGYTPSMYKELEQRRSYWMSRCPWQDDEISIGLEALIRQICALELDINRDRADGKSVDKSVTALNSLLGSAMLKPAQKSDAVDAAIEKTPFGVWIDRWENKRPIPEPDPELQDVDGIVKYVTTWFLGHLCKMLGIKNSYCKLYEEEMAKLRIEHPEYDDDDDETLFNDIFASNDTAEDSD